MRKLLVPLVAAVTAAGLVAALAAAVGRDDPNKKHFKYAIGLWGDVPYSDLQAQVGVPNLIADMNRADIEFSVHNGDLKAGSGSPTSATPTTCADALYEQALGYFETLEQPAVFTPGDNDWTDCDRPANGGFGSLERLDHEREVFFSTNRSLGGRTMKMQVQTTPLCPGSAGPVRCVENRRWTLHGVTYATFNVQGSCNNRCDVLPDDAEWAGRNAANIAWLQATFAEAAEQQSAAVMLLSQANPGFGPADGTGAPARNAVTLVETDGQPDGFHEWLLEVRALTVAFGKPVAYVHGDSHYLRVDKPLIGANGRRVSNFTRVETFGDNAPSNTDVNWVKVLVDPHGREVFAFQPQVVPENQQ